MINTVTILPAAKNDLRSFVEKTSGQKLLRCYQCGKCTAGCPTAYLWDLTPRQVMRAVQLGLKEELMRTHSYWLCVFCQTCSARCPQEIDIAAVMDSLRHLAILEKRAPAEKEVALFHRHFLRLVHRFGKVWEVGLGGLYNLTSGHPLANTSLLPAMFARGKLPLLPHTTHNMEEIRNIFKRAEELERKSAGPETGRKA
ncbi:MAG: 4Fe-4S dicluster domain-containing protein [Dehalococcoidia bacterium]|nr:4Fe-4S dicluster domain-containing protein [Dehalococcoidia bacterium]